MTSLFQPIFPNKRIDFPADFAGEHQFHVSIFSGFLKFSESRDKSIQVLSRFKGPYAENIRKIEHIRFVGVYLLDFRSEKSHVDLILRNPVIFYDIVLSCLRNSDYRIGRTESASNEEIESENVNETVMLLEEHGSDVENCRHYFVFAKKIESMGTDSIEIVD
ncbi:MAG: hypothetical protein QMC36_06045 [Patescibacteria group bacterium]